MNYKSRLIELEIKRDKIDYQRLCIMNEAHRLLKHKINQLPDELRRVIMLYLEWLPFDKNDFMNYYNSVYPLYKCNNEEYRRPPFGATTCHRALSLTAYDKKGRETAYIQDSIGEQFIYFNYHTHPTHHHSKVRHRIKIKSFCFSPFDTKASCKDYMKHYMTKYEPTQIKELLGFQVYTSRLTLDQLNKIITYHKLHS